MKHSLEFDKSHLYDDSNGIVVPIRLLYGSRRSEFDAHIDTGASHCLFERNWGEDLGLIIEHGYRRTFSTANSGFEAFGHELTINVLDIEIESMVYFFADREIRKNVLGRRGWLDRVRLGLIDYDHTLFLSPYNMA